MSPEEAAYRFAEALRAVAGTALPYRGVPRVRLLPTDPGRLRWWAGQIADLPGGALLRAAARRLLALVEAGLRADGWLTRAALLDVWCEVNRSVL